MKKREKKNLSIEILVKFHTWLRETTIPSVLVTENDEKIAECKSLLFFFLGKQNEPETKISWIDKIIVFITFLFLAFPYNVRNLWLIKILESSVDKTSSLTISFRRLNVNLLSFSVPLFLVVAYHPSFFNRMTQAKLRPTNSVSLEFQYLRVIWWIQTSRSLDINVVQFFRR